MKEIREIIPKVQAYAAFNAMKKAGVDTSDQHLRELGICKYCGRGGRIDSIIKWMDEHPLQLMHEIDEYENKHPNEIITIDERNKKKKENILSHVLSFVLVIITYILWRAW